MYAPSPVSLLFCGGIPIWLQRLSVRSFLSALPTSRDAPSAAPCTQENGCGIQVFVRHGQTFSLDNMCGCDDVDALIAAVESKCKVSQGDFWLAFQGRKLEEGRPLHSYGICSGSTVHFALRGRGGGCPLSRLHAEIDEAGRF